MGADPKAVGVAAIAAALAGGGYLIYKVVNGERITPTPEDMKEVVDLIKNSAYGGADGSPHEKHDYENNELDQDGRIVFS
ncbi:hypothetical protein [uncultured Selenomonas sp.]|uniref:hypothetical protein n=1 Tax=uncultured Selenomonas sp. TaxID=159275 RepID=UPI0028DB6708|nr:hypothetical protein [uncultured Selenomonas sp.]